MYRGKYKIPPLRLPQARRTACVKKSGCLSPRRQLALRLRCPALHEAFPPPGWLRAGLALQLPLLPCVGGMCSLHPVAPVSGHHRRHTWRPAQARTADPRPSFLEALPLRDADPHMTRAKGFTQQPLEETCHLERLVLRSEVTRICHRQKLGQK